MIIIHFLHDFLYLTCQLKKSTSIIKTRLSCIDTQQKVIKKKNICKNKPISFIIGNLEPVLLHQWLISSYIHIRHQLFYRPPFKDSQPWCIQQIRCCLILYSTICGCAVVTPWVPDKWIFMRMRVFAIKEIVWNIMYEDYVYGKR